MKKHIAVSLFALCLSVSVKVQCAAAGTDPAITVQDDVGNSITLAQPARRIVSLAPNFTEVLFAAGAGDRVVGAVEFSDYPAQAKQISRIGRHNALDLERILSLQPDLVIAWDSGNPKHQVSQLQQLGLTVYRGEPRRLHDIADTLRRFGRLAGTEKQADAAAHRFLQRYHALTQQYRQRPVLSVFYQIWDQPLMTLSGRHMVNDIIELCGGQNVFARLQAVSPTVSTEAVIAANPQVIIASSSGKPGAESLQRWRQWPQIPAVRYHNLFVIPADIIHRNTPRILDGVQRLCELLDQARAHNAGHENRATDNDKQP